MWEMHAHARDGWDDRSSATWNDRVNGMPNPDRPTLAPTFDMEAYARESDERIRSAGAQSGIVPAAADAFVEASELVDDAEAAEVYWACLGGGDRVLVLAQPLNELLALPRRGIDGFVVSYVDGQRTARELVEASGLPTLVALVGLCELLERGVVY
jgi:hypothetical protein